MPLISNNERVKLVASIAYRGFTKTGSRSDSISWAADFVEAVEAELSRRRPAVPRTVEDWMRENAREPYCTGIDWYWDGPDSEVHLGKEELPAEVWAKMRCPNDTCGDYDTRDEAVADLRRALLSLNLIQS
jgi:hypothetical protein